MACVFIIMCGLTFCLFHNKIYPSFIASLFEKSVVAPALVPVQPLVTETPSERVDQASSQPPETESTEEDEDEGATLSSSAEVMGPLSVHFEVDKDGLATVDGDIVLGTPKVADVSQGSTQISDLTLWPGGRVPFFIQNNLEKPDRVVQALAMFVDTPVQLVPYQEEKDVLVFQNAVSGCKSYVGKVGGKQPVWIGPECGPSEIAHEIMHALGFIHEQNRSDREGSVHVVLENVQDSAKKNFELVPASLMKVSGAAPFDFQSIMLYPPTMFAKNGLTTMHVVDPKNEIHPGHELSAGDLARLQKTYPK